MKMKNEIKNRAKIRSFNLLTLRKSGRLAPNPRHSSLRRTHVLQWPSAFLCSSHFCGKGGRGGTGALVTCETENEYISDRPCDEFCTCSNPTWLVWRLSPWALPISLTRIYV